ncbi:MAG: AzlC family ABC transporter permease [Rhizobiaceae bacterium]
MAAHNDISEWETAFGWYRRGLLRLFSFPALILMGAFMGFTGLAKDAGLSLWQTEFMVLTIWALPSKVVLIGAIASKASLFAAFVAVSLSAVRLMPMTVALVPEMRTEKTRKLTLYVLSHFVAVTAWVMSMETFKDVPKAYRTVYFGGIASALMVSNLIVVFVTFETIKNLPPLVSAALVFVTPIYFLCSLWGSARERAGHYAMIAGLVLTPLIHAVFPQGDILITGVIGGTFAYMFARKKPVRLP